MIRRLVLPVGLVVIAGAFASPASAQLPSILPPNSYIRDTWYPKVFWTPRQGFTAGGQYRLVWPLRYSDYPSPSPYRMAMALDGQVSTSGSRYISLDAFAPDFVGGWRFRLTFRADRANREDFFGIGNASQRDPANVTDQQPYYYRLRHLRTFARGEIQRRIVGPLRLLVGFQAEHWSLDSLSDGASAFGMLLRSTPALGAARNDVAGRVGLVVDTRDDESAPQKGLLLEAMLDRADSSALGDVTYTRALVSLRGYVPIGEKLVLAARVAGQTMTDSAPLGSKYLIEASDQPFTGIGGPSTNRGLRSNRLIGRDKLFGNFDVRYHVFQVPTLVRVTVFGWVDAARVFDDGEDFRITTDGLAVGGGGGLMLQLLRDAFLGLSVGAGPDGAQVQVLTNWTY